MVLRITGIVLLLAIGFIAFAKWDEYQRACEMRDNQDFRRQFPQETDVSSEISFIDPTPTPMPRFSIIGLFDDQKIDPKTRDSRGYSAQDYSTASEECAVEEEDLAIALTGRQIHMLEALSRARHPELYKAQATKDSPHKATPISPEEARDHVGESVSVRGLVEQISLFEEGYAFLSFSGYPHEIFKGFVPAQSVDHVGGEQFLKSLGGNPITVIGKIELYIGHPEIVISSPEQIVRE